MPPLQVRKELAHWHCITAIPATSRRTILAPGYFAVGTFFFH
jgi:hypothetical protein